METLVVVMDHRNRYCNRVKSHGLARFGSSASPSTYFNGINCRAFESGAGLLPTPFKYCSIPIINQPSKTTWKSSAIPINNNNRTPRNDKSFNEISGDGFMYSELWAGPAYSNSPPPSSLPIPKFSLRSKRSMSLDLPADYPVVDVHLTAKSAPASPTRELDPSVMELFHSVDSATKTLRRILNLDNTDD